MKVYLVFRCLTSPWAGDLDDDGIPLAGRHREVLAVYSDEVRARAVAASLSNHDIEVEEFEVDRADMQVGPEPL